MRRLLIVLAIALLPSIALAHGGGLSGGHIGGGLSGGHMGGGLSGEFPFKGQHLAHDHRHHHHRAFGLWPYGYYDVPPYASDLDMTYSIPETVEGAPTPSVRCQHSEQTVNVPSENGGVREVTILRC